MKKLKSISKLALFLGICFSPLTTFGTGELDKIYSFRSIVPLVLHWDTDPVYAEHLENELVRYMKSNSRFDFNNEAYIQLKEETGKVYSNDANVPTKDKIDWFKEPILAANKKGVDAVLIIEIFQTFDIHKIVAVLATSHGLEWIKSKEFAVEDKYNLESYTQVVGQIMDTFYNEFPFNGSVIRRDGYRVVIDRGFPEVQIGQELSTYTVEKLEEKDKPDRLYLLETGQIRITEAGEKVSFGQIIVEKRPLEVSSLNKLLLDSHSQRSLAFDPELSQKTFVKREFGNVELNVGTSFITVHNLDAAGVGSTTDNKMFPGANLAGHIWITNRMSGELDVQFAMASLSPSANSATTSGLSSSMTDFRLLLNYQLGMGRAVGTPSVILKVGYMRHGFSVDSSSDPLSYSSTTHSGIVVGAGTSFAVSEKMRAGFDANYLLLSSFSEGPYLSGDEVKNVSGWDFALKGVYKYNDEIDFLGKISFHSYGAEFTGAGTRPTPLASISQSGRSFTAGLAYYF